MLKPAAQGVRAQDQLNMGRFRIQYGSINEIISSRYDRIQQMLQRVCLDG